MSCVSKTNVSRVKKPARYAFVVKELNRIYVAGQTEPQRVVFTPGSVEAREAQKKYIELHVSAFVSSHREGFLPTYTNHIEAPWL